jgi:hypothetical protein
MATGGGRHSSAEAKLLSSGIESYQGSRLEADKAKMAYEDTLRSQMFGQGQSLMGMETGMKQGDITNVLNWLGTVGQGYGLDLAGMQQLLSLMGLEGNYADVTTSGTA